MKKFIVKMSRLVAEVHEAVVEANSLEEAMAMTVTDDQWKIVSEKTPGIDFDVKEKKNG